MAKTWVGVLFFLWGTTAGADVYKWTDAHGGVHYGDKAVPGTSAQVVDVPTSAIADNGPIQLPERGLSRDERDWLNRVENNDAAAARAQRKRAIADERAAAKQARAAAGACHKAKTKLADYQERLTSGCRRSDCERYEIKVKKYQADVTRSCR